MRITKCESNVAKGLAIFMIAIHNFIHSEKMGFTPENEMNFNLDRSLMVLKDFCSPSFHLVGEFFSFLGWVGVPLFVFMSGYGLTKKYGVDSNRIDSRFFIKYNYLKLLLLMLPGVMFYTLGFIREHEWVDAINSIGSLSMMGNLWFFVKRLNPGIYWYFGLTFQLYMVFLWYVKRGSFKSLVWLSIASIIFIPVLYYVCERNINLEYYKRQFLGWLPLFVLGIYCAKNTSTGDTIKRLLSGLMGGVIGKVIIVISCIVLMVVMNMNFVTWIFVPFVALVFFFAAVTLLCSNKLTCTAFEWVGVYSSCVFVLHPIVRSIVVRCLPDLEVLPLTIIYLAVVLLVAPIYNILISKLKKAFKIK